jgi:inner membrane protein
VDTLTHALSGALVGRLLAPRRPANASACPARSAEASRSPTLPVWQAVIAGTLAAIFPDLDFVLGWISELTYLKGHRGVTHSLILLPLWGLLITWPLLHLWRHRHTPASRPRLYLIVCAALLVHILGDLITQFGTMILSPFSDRRFALGTTFIIDLPFTGIILAGLLGSALLRHSRTPAALSLLLLCGWVGLSAIGRSEALQAARDHARALGIDPVSVDASPRPASPFNWTAIVFDGTYYHFAHINTRRSTPMQATPKDHFIRRFSAPYQPVSMAQWERRAHLGEGLDEPVRTRVNQVWQAETFAMFRWFFSFPVLDRVDHDQATGTTCISFLDLRFLTPARDQRPFRYGLCGQAGDTPTDWRLFERTTDDSPRWINLR